MGGNHTFFSDITLLLSSVNREGTSVLNGKMKTVWCLIFLKCGQIADFPPFIII